MKRSKVKDENPNDTEKGLDNDKYKFDDKPLKPKSKYPTFGQNLKDYFSEYSNNTSIHGLKYLGEKKRNFAEKLIWLIIFVVSLWICITMILKTYDKWDSSPVIVSFARSPTPVWHIPFPAVTFCSETKARQTVYNFTEAYHKMFPVKNMTEEEERNFERISLVCDNHLYGLGNKTIGLDTIDFLSEVTPNYDETLYQCKWTNTNTSCHELFTPVLTEEGVCYTFNMLDREELFTNIVFHNRDYLSHGQRAMNWTLEHGYPKDAELETFPRRAISAGQGAGLIMLMRAYQQDLDYICRGPVQGFKILLHNPVEIPRVSQHYFRAPLNQEVVVSIKPDMMTTSEGLKSYDPHRRQCYFPSERPLRFFKIYTQQNCDAECLTNHTLLRCQCVAYHMPHDEGTALCGPGSILCMHQAQVELLQREVRSGLESYEHQESSDPDEDTTDRKCDCLPACTSLTYNAENSQADFKWEKVFEAFKANFSEMPGVQFTRVTLFFKEQQFITSERNELYGQTDFLANCGGLLGLFMGFSFLSVIEILYFLSLRLLCNILRFGRHFWSGSVDLVNNDAYEHKH